MGRALAREVGQEDDAAGARGSRRGFVHQLLERHARRERVARPLQRARGREHHSHRVPGARHRVAEHVHARLRIGLVGGQRGEHDAGGPEHERDGPGPLDSDAERRGGAVARARGDGNAVRRAARDLGRLERARHPLLGQLERLQDGGREAALGDVEEQRARGVCHVDRALAAEPQPHVVLGQQDVPDARVGRGLVLAQPEQLGGGEARQRAVSGQRDQALEPDALLDLGALGGRALVVPEDRRAQHAAPARRAPRARASGPRARCRRSRGRRVRPWPPRSPSTSPRAPAPTSPAAAARGRSGSRRARRRCRRRPRRAP